MYVSQKYISGDLKIDTLFMGKCIVSSPARFNDIIKACWAISADFSREF